MASRIHLVPFEAEEFLSGIQAQIDASKEVVPSQGGAVQFFPPFRLDGLIENVPEIPSEENFCEHDYLLSNPDIADAVRRGEFKSGFDHWIRLGQREGRSFHPAEFIETEYLELNPEVIQNIQAGQFESGHDHWRRSGRLDGRRITKPMSRLLSRLKRLSSEMQVRLAQIGEAPADPGTFRGAVGRQIILVLRRLLWWHTQSVSAFADATGRGFKEQVAVLEHLGTAQEQNHRTVVSIQQAVAHIGAKLEKSENQQQQLASAICQLESDVRSATELNASLVAELQRFFIRMNALENRVNAESDHKSDALYLAFVNTFRGPREEIKRRQAVYLPFLKEAQLGTPEAPVLDLGCGRGEWLELLRDQQMTAHGREDNIAMVEHCRALGLEVEKGEALAYLRNLPDRNLGAITCFHVIEHIPFDAVVSLLEECIRVLKTGGLLILETPNPNNLRVASQSFYLDPTHLKPLPPEMLRFFVEAIGFANCQVLELQPGPAPPDGESMNLPKHVSELLYGPRDYGLIARRP